MQRPGEGQRRDDDPERRIGAAHRAQDGAVADPVAGHPEQRRQQRAEIEQRPEQGQRQHRTGLDQDVPAEHQILHLDAPRGREVGGKLETEAAHLERRQHRNPGDHGHAGKELGNSG